LFSLMDRTVDGFAPCPVVDNIDRGRPEISAGEGSLHWASLASSRDKSQGPLIPFRELEAYVNDLSEAYVLASERCVIDHDGETWQAGMRRHKGGELCEVGVKMADGLREGADSQATLRAAIGNVVKQRVDVCVSYIGVGAGVVVSVEALRGVASQFCPHI
jgi:hypothetical protein